MMSCPFVGRLRVVAKDDNRVIYFCGLFDWRNEGCTRHELI